MPDFSARFDDHWLLDGARTPLVDYCGALAEVSPIDLGIKAARAALTRAQVPGAAIDSVVTASMAQASFDAYMLPRHIGLYAGVPIEVPAILVQRICGSGFEIIRQAADQITLGYASLALVVGAESMSRNPVCAYTHRGGFRLGAPVEFKDFLWEALDDPAAKVSMIQTAENLARKYGITRAEVDAYAASSFERALRAQADGFHAGEIVPVTSERFELDGYEPRGIKLPRKVAVADRDTHPRLSPLEALAALRPVYEGGVQTAGNSSALVDGAAAVGLAHAAVAAQEVSDPAVVAAFQGAGGAGIAVGDPGEQDAVAGDFPDQEPGFAEPVVGEAELAVAEHGAFPGEVPEGLPPLLEVKLPGDRVVRVVDLAQAHHELAQRLAGGGAGVAGQVAGGVHLQVEDAPLVHGFRPGRAQRGGQSGTTIGDDHPGGGNLFQQRSPRSDGLPPAPLPGQQVALVADREQQAPGPDPDPVDEYRVMDPRRRSQTRLDVPAPGGVTPEGC